MILLLAALLLAPAETATLSSGDKPAPGQTLKIRDLQLTLGKRYVLSGSIRTENLTITEGDRSTVPTAASLSMASMPWDVHTESIAGTKGWTRVQLKFTATRTADAAEIRVAPGAAFSGKAFAKDVSVEELNEPPAWPTKLAVKSFGPAYRYPKGGWIYLHIEGQPYERGFQHGYLMQREIEGYIDRCAAQLNSKDRTRGWSHGRAIANAVFLRAFDQEILSEMKGIADGAAAAGAKYEGRKVDLVDIVAANTVTELGLLNPASEITPTGLEGLGLRPPAYFDPHGDVPVSQRCSAFAATGKATRDGHMVIGHVTMWSLTLAEQTNVMLDLKPAEGHRVLMQSFPGGIQSGTDWYQNDAGVILTETTIRQTPFNIAGAPVAYRARKAIQYGGDVDGVVKHLSERNNGLYTNEWLIGDAKNDEVAMFELGTNKTRLYRSSRNDWFGGTEGFYWGCNNTKDLQVRLEYVPDPNGEPEHVPYTPIDRDLKWQQMYDQYRGRIDEQFGFTAFRTPPLVGATTFDAKITTAGMAKQMMVWGVLGKPNEREWVPSRRQKDTYSGNEGIHSSGYRLFAALEPSPASAPAPQPAKPAPSQEWKKVSEDKLWMGWILPATDADEWLSLGGAYYYHILASDKPEDALNAWRLRMRDSAENAKIGRAVLQFDAIRRQIGDEPFLKMMREFYAAHTTRTVRTADFPVPPPSVPDPAPGALLSGVYPRLGNALIVYGTDSDAGSNRHAAELLQSQLNDFHETRIPILRDFEFTPELAAARTLIFIGRPETNSALRVLAEKLTLHFDGASFEIGGNTYTGGRDGLAWAGVNPANPKEIVVVLAGNSAVETVALAAFRPAAKSWQVTHSGKPAASGF